MEEKLGLLSQLINLAKVDNVLDEQEIGFIHAVGNMMGLSDPEMLGIFEEPHAFQAPQSEFERIIQFHRMVLLMNVNEDVNPKQLEYIKRMGFRLGLNPGATDEVLKRMYDYKNHVIPPAELIKIFQRYHN